MMKEDCGGEVRRGIEAQLVYTSPVEEHVRETH